MPWWRDWPWPGSWFARGTEAGRPGDEAVRVRALGPGPGAWEFGRRVAVLDGGASGERVPVRRAVMFSPWCSDGRRVRA